MIEKKIIEILTRCLSFQDAPDEIVRMSKYLRFVLHCRKSAQNSRNDNTNLQLNEAGKLKSADRSNVQYKL